ncbi:replication protein [Paraburkholderia bannensis]|uniref:replication protein n=1 Tax=Paraburkholderia bannensis TaxID=765414 RepID=UPI002AB67466|nr:replication protein [Paraburkholderia bannensis]
MEDHSPQLEDGFTRIANELFEAILRFGFTQRQLLILLSIVRKTYGFGKKEDDMSASQIALMCSMHRPHVSTVLGELERMKVITKSAGRYGMVIGLNKKHASWLPLERATKVGAEPAPLALVHPSTSTESVQGCTKSVLVDGVPNWYSTSTESVQVDSTESVHTKENLPKETQKKGRARRAELTFAGWLAACKAANEKPIPNDDPIFDYADKQRLPIDFVRYAWLEFRRKCSDNGKKQKDWRAHFRNAVRENWYGIWFDLNGDYQLTTRGKQVKREHEEAA